MTHCILGEIRRRPMLGALAAVFGALASIATAVCPAAAQNGALVQTQPLYGAPDGAAAYRILYRSTGLSGEPIVVSGMVVIPQGDPPPGGRPIVAWAHPTTGVAPRCAPSLARVRFQMIQGLRDMVERGYVVTATDYPGLGTPQTHPYLVGDSEGRAVLDSVRAARALPGAQASSRFAVWGHSQGGQAALYTGLLARGYAPDLQLVGVAAAAPATELSALMRDDLGTSGGNNLTAMTLWSWARVYGAPIDNVVEPAAMPAVNRLAGECIESIFDLFERRRTEKSLEHRFLSVKNFAGDEPWRSLLARNTPGALAPDIPVFLAQGDADKLVRPEVTADYMRRLCRDGSSVRMVVLPGVGHGMLGRDSANAAVAWMADRFAGTPAPSDCGQR
jgi:acetyl esterase/lipase